MPEAPLSDVWVDEPPLDAMPEPPPTQDELPCDDGEPMETQRHKWQMDLLIETMDRWLEQRGAGYTGGNMFVYFDLAQTRGKYFRGPDFFAVLGVPRGERKSWVVWQEGRAPDVIVELLSQSTVSYDKHEKKEIYQDQLRVPEYFWFNPFNPEDRMGFCLNDGIYHAITPDERGRLLSPRLNLLLTLWQGIYRGLPGTWLRWETPEGELLPTDGEAARREVKLAKDQAEQARQHAEKIQRELEQEKQRANAATEALQAAEAELARLRVLGDDRT
jgi:Uma2 family endonuclease